MRSNPTWIPERVLVLDIIPHQGPLGGIYTALLFSPSEWVLVKATDMPFLVPELASLIIDAKEGFDAVVPKLVQDFYDPLLAMYNRRCLPQSHANSGARQAPGHRLLPENKASDHSEEEWRKVDPDALSFKNVNTPSDLAEIDGLARS